MRWRLPSKSGPKTFDQPESKIQKKIAAKPGLSSFAAHLAGELDRRCKANPSYSLRAFAKALTLEPSYLSKVIRGERAPTASIILRTGERLGVNPLLIRDWIEFSSHAEAEQQRRRHENLDATYVPLSDDQLAGVSEWYHYAILELLDVEGFACSAKSVSRALEISLVEAQGALNQMLSLGLLVRSKSCEVKASGKSYSSIATQVGTTDALRRVQSQILAMADQAMQKTPFEERSQTSMTLAVDSSQLKAAQELIKEFRRKFSHLMKASPKRDRVYHLNVSFYPVTPKLTHLKSWASRALMMLACLTFFNVSVFAQTPPSDGGGGQEGGGGGDIEAHFGLRAREVADFFETHPEAGGQDKDKDKLKQINWKEFKTYGTKTRVNSVPDRPMCRHQDGSIAARDACYFVATKSESAHIDVYETGFMGLPPARQHRLVSHEVFRAMGLGQLDESYELSNPIYVAMQGNSPQGEVEPADTGTIRGLMRNGVYSNFYNQCSLRLDQPDIGNGEKVLVVTFVQTGSLAEAPCPQLHASFVSQCGSTSCRVEFSMRRAIPKCYRLDSDGSCRIQGNQYVDDEYLYVLTPTEEGKLNVLTTIRSGRDGKLEIGQSRTYVVQKLSQ